MEHVSIWGTPFPAILNQKNSTGSAGGAKNSQNGGILVPPKIDNIRPVSTSQHGRRRQGQGHHGLGLCFDGSFCGLKIGGRTVKHSNYNSQ